MWGNEKFNQKALFSDESGNYRKPAEPRQRRTGGRLNFEPPGDDVDLVYSDLRKSDRQPWKKHIQKICLITMSVLWDRWKEPVHYFFEIIAGNQRCFYNKLGVDGRSAGSVFALPDSAGFSHAGLGEGRSYVPDLTQTGSGTESRQMMWKTVSIFIPDRYVHKVTGLGEAAGCL